MARNLMHCFIEAVDRVPEFSPRPDQMATEMRALADRMERHVVSRMPGSAPGVPNGAWQMMLDAARLLRLAAGRRG